MENKHLLLVILATALVLAQEFAGSSASKNKKDVNRKSIVFDIKTPKVFYCQQEKQSDYTKMIVKAKPLDKLCEFDGGPKPKNTPSDCYNDVDETKYACDEKKRFLVSPPSSFEFNQCQSTHSNPRLINFHMPSFDLIRAPSLPLNKVTHSIWET